MFVTRVLGTPYPVINQVVDVAMMKYTKKDAGRVSAKLAGPLSYFPTRVRKKRNDKLPRTRADQNERFSAELVLFSSTGCFATFSIDLLRHQATTLDKITKNAELL